MSLRIAFDLDGLLADMNSALRREEERLFGRPALGRAARGNPIEPPPASPGDTPAAPGLADQAREARALTDRQHRRLWQAVRATNDFWETLPEIEQGAVAAIAGRARDRRWEVIFLTSRPETAGSTPQLQTQRWLRKHGFELPSVFVVTGSRGKIAEALCLDVVVDDLPENCLDVLSDSKATAILVWHGGPDAVPAGLRQHGCTVVSSVEECLSTLAGLEMDAPPTTLLGRLKSAIGQADTP